MTSKLFKENDYHNPMMDLTRADEHIYRAKESLRLHNHYISGFYKCVEHAHYGCDQYENAAADEVYTAAVALADLYRSITGKHFMEQYREHLAHEANCVRGIEHYVVAKVANEQEEQERYAADACKREARRAEMADRFEHDLLAGLNGTS